MAGDERSFGSGSVVGFVNSCGLWVCLGYREARWTTARGTSARGTAQGSGAVGTRSWSRCTRFAPSGCTRLAPRYTHPMTAHHIFFQLRLIGEGEVQTFCIGERREVRHAP